MADTVKQKTIYIGQLPVDEVGLAERAARALGFFVPITYGPGPHYDVTPTNHEITVDPGNYGVMLSYPEDAKVGSFWDTFFALKREGSSGKEQQEV